MCQSQSYLDYYLWDTGQKKLFYITSLCYNWSNIGLNGTLCNALSIYIYVNQYWIWNTLGCSINMCKVQSQTIGTAHWYFVCNGQRNFRIALSLLNSKKNLIHILTLYLICGSFAEDRNSRSIWLGVPKYKFLLAIRLVAIGSEVVPEDGAPHVEVFYKYIRYITTYLLNMLFILFACIWRHTHFSLTVFFSLLSC